VTITLTDPANDTDWMRRGSCNDKPYNGFTEKPVPEQRAICQTCPVAVDCRVWALEAENMRILAAAQTGHVYGGLTPKQIVKRGMAKPAGEWRAA
jgi:hypothetical protein